MFIIQYIWQCILYLFNKPRDIYPFYEKLYELHNSDEYCVRYTIEEHLVFTLLKLSIYTTKWSLISDNDLNELRRLSNYIYSNNQYKFKNIYYTPKLSRDEVLQCINCIDNGRFYQELRKSVARKLILYM